MKNKWLNLVLLLTNRIYSRKQLVRGQAGFRAIFDVAILIALEIFLGIISLPLYISLKPDKVTAFMVEKGTYVKVSFDYNLRRVLTLTGVVIFILIWAIKLILILALPQVYGPLQLYSVSNFKPVDISANDLITSEVGIQTAKVVDTLSRPELTEVKKIAGGNYVFFGKGQPGSTVVLLLSDKQTAVYSADVDKDGNWQISHSQARFRLSEGNHSVIVFSYDKKLGIRSPAAPEQVFKVSAGWWNSLTKNVDNLANWLVIIILLLGVFLTILTI